MVKFCLECRCKTAYWLLDWACPFIHGVKGSFWTLPASSAVCSLCVHTVGIILDSDSNGRELNEK